MHWSTSHGVLSVAERDGGPCRATLSSMVEVLIAEPGELSEAQLDAAETLVRNAFGFSFRSHDWRHAVQGVHVALTDGETLVAFAAVVARTLHHGGVAFDTGYVEGVAVRADQQGRGLGRAVMEHAETIIHTRHQLGALNAVENAADFYAARCCGTTNPVSANAAASLKACPSSAGCWAPG